MPGCVRTRARGSRPLGTQPLLSFDPSLRLCVYNDAALPCLASHMQQKRGDITLSARCGEAKVEALVVGIP